MDELRPRAAGDDEAGDARRTTWGVIVLNHDRDVNRRDGGT
jgi:hypothetical protein